MKGRGSRGEGSVDAVCWRIVLDANLFRGAPVGEIEALRARGYQVSVSLEGLREVWARSIREGEYKLLSARVARLAPVLSENDPIAFAGHSLLTTFGTAGRRLREESARYRSSVSGGWRRIVANGLLEDDWRSIGAELQDELRDGERNWAQHVADAQGIVRQVSAAEKEAGSPLFPRARGSDLMRQSLAKGAGVACVPPLVARADLHLRYTTDKLLNAHQRVPAVNDWNDARHLQHVAWPAFLATCDEGLIEAADRTGSPQSAWVRMPIELIEDRVARCEPWAKGASTLTFRRAPLPELRARQEAFRRSLRRQSGSPALAAG
ncbi:MAG: hypothetical protein FJ104_15345 [Deltaproteobacteria bacterium]|nr:hypothetical protein [Deltaproteobacteria bacterium]